MPNASDTICNVRQSMWGIQQILDTGKEVTKALYPWESAEGDRHRPQQLPLFEDAAIAGVGKHGRGPCLSAAS